ncbi:DUF6779 domain-containing protein [Nocardia sp. alder85J]|uniref:DUF6779 domain-containing protein n=1 Tax=Nocardia sp. alder85J TaxID=2862949 RepID=UPI001CD3DC54|nr:DUF6779 domain-containing protein [Nocardia sp. alder85J]MCX4093541.1 hypothetical protein [Nocardia sp. alder85J]
MFLIFSDSLQLVRIGLVAALWAAVLGALAATRYRRESTDDQVKMRDLQKVYKLQLEREVSARREFEHQVESRVREEVGTESAELAALRAELAVLRENLQRLFDGVQMDHRPALHADAFRIQELPSASSANGNHTDTDWDPWNAPPLSSLSMTPVFEPDHPEPPAFASPYDDPVTAETSIVPPENAEPDPTADPHPSDISFAAFLDSHASETFASFDDYRTGVFDPFDQFESFGLPQPGVRHTEPIARTGDRETDRDRRADRDRRDESGWGEPQDRPSWPAGTTRNDAARPGDPARDPMARPADPARDDRDWDDEDWPGEALRDRSGNPAWPGRPPRDEPARPAEPTRDEPGRPRDAFRGNGTGAAAPTPDETAWPGGPARGAEPWAGDAIRGNASWNGDAPRPAEAPRGGAIWDRGATREPNVAREPGPARDAAPRDGDRSARNGWEPPPAHPTAPGWQDQQQPPAAEEPPIGTAGARRRRRAAEGSTHRLSVAEIMANLRSEQDDDPKQ